MNLVFKVGDVVYHPYLGKVTVETVDEDDPGATYNVKTEGGGSWWLNERELSFEPWPEPVHKRPIQEGWWVVCLEGTHCLNKHLSGKWYYPDKHIGIRESVCQEETKPVKFIGELT